jgi:hypothetical protein
MTEQNLIKLDKKLTDLVGGGTAISNLKANGAHKKQNSIGDYGIERDGGVQVRRSLDVNHGKNSAVSSQASKRTDPSRSSMGGASQRSMSNAMRDVGS